MSSNSCWGFEFFWSQKSLSPSLYVPHTKFVFVRPLFHLHFRHLSNVPKFVGQVSSGFLISFPTNVKLFPVDKSVLHCIAPLV